MNFEPSILDYAESILTLERQAIRQAEQGNKDGLVASLASLRAIVKDCEAALAPPNLSEGDRQWLQNKLDKAQGALV